MFADYHKLIVWQNSYLEQTAVEDQKQEEIKSKSKSLEATKQNIEEIEIKCLEASDVDTD